MIAVEDRLPIAARHEVLRELRTLMRGRWITVASLACILALTAAAALVVPIALGRLVDAVVDGQPTSYLGVTGALIGGAAVVWATLGAFAIVVSGRLFEPLVAQLREQLVERSMHVAPAVVERAGTGDLLTRAGNDLYAVSYALSAVLPTFSASVFAVVATVAGMAIVDPRLLLALVVAAPLQVLAVRYFLRTAPPLWAEAMVADSTRSNQVIGSFRGAETVAAFGLGDHQLDRIGRATWPVVRYGLLTRIVSNRFFGRLTASELAGLAGLLVVGFWLVDSGRATIGAATTGMLLVFRLFQPIGQMLLVLDVTQTGLTSLARIIGVIQMPAPDMDQAETRVTYRPVRPARVGAVDIDDVSFSYRDGHPVLDGVSLHIDPGEHVAIVGTSGAGKTTLAMLMAGIFHPASGQILLDGEDLRTMPRIALTAQVALISQATHTFEGSLRDDLTLARDDAEDSEVGAALDAVRATGWVAALPHGLDTAVGSDGHRLSTAQEQQVALARLVLKDPSVAILDEATAEAGSSAARLLERAAEAVTVGRTTVTIAHRLSQAARADRVIVMERGRVVEQGPHAEFVARSGQYAGLWRTWSTHR